jgi:hypothetical protein
VTQEPVGARVSLITWSVNSTGGRLYSGIPSQDVAIAMAVDLERYGTYDDDDEPMERYEVTVDLEAREYPDDPTFIHVYAEDSRGLGVLREERCAMCRLTAEGRRY